MARARELLGLESLLHLRLHIVRGDVDEVAHILGVVASGSVAEVEAVHLSPDAIGAISCISFLMP